MASGEWLVAREKDPRADRPESPSGTQTARPTSSPRAMFAKGRTSFALPSFFCMLSPTIPAHRRHSPVSPIIPALTQKQGGGVAPNKELTVPGGQLPGGKKKADPSRKMTLAAEFLCHSSSGDFNRLEDSAPSCGLSTVNCKLDFLRPAFTITLIAIVGAPTFLRLAWPLSFLRIFLNSKLTTDHLKLSNSNHSRTYARVARKSNYSRTYVRQGGGGR